MKNCELFFVRGGDDFDKLSESFNDIAKTLYHNDYKVKYQTNITGNSKKINTALETSLSDNDLSCFIFANALDTKDSTSFKNQFSEFITNQEANLNTDTNQKGAPKIKITTLGDFGNGYKGYCFKLHDKTFIVLPKASLCNKDNISLLLNGLNSAKITLARLEKETTDGISYLSQKKVKKPLLKRIFPQKEDDNKEKTKKIITLIASLVLIVAIGYLINYFIIAPMLNRQVNSEIQTIAHNVTKVTDSGPSQDWDALKEINDEIVGWITMDDTEIDYPVLEHIGDDQDSQYYLYRTYKKDWSVYGSCFVDYRSTESVHSKNVIIHGHNMNDGSMFHALLDYGGLDGDLDFYKEHPIVKFNTPEGDAEWKIFSVFKTNTLYSHGEFFNYMQGSFNSDAEFMNFVYNCKIRSLFDIPVTVNEDDQILTLSTCSYEYSNFRTVVVARKVRQGEKGTVNVDKATYNENVVFPEIYYSRNGGERPEVLTFKKANQKGLISWYDGKGNLKGDETLTGTVIANPTESPGDKGNSNNRPNNATYTFYTVNFLNYDGSIFYSTTVKEGDPVPYPDSNPTIPDDDYYTYNFKGWQTEGFDLDHCYYGMDIAPDFEAVLK